MLVFKCDCDDKCRSTDNCCWRCGATARCLCYIVLTFRAVHCTFAANTLLQGVVNAAQLEAIHDHLAHVSAAASTAAAAAPVATTSNATCGNAAVTEAVASTGVTVEARHVQAAFAQARPSMSARDRAEHEAAYRKFAGGRAADFHPASSTDDGTLRTALK
jgi:hypothetical protein